MDFLHDFGLGLLMLFVALVIYDWGRIWWYSRRHGYIKITDTKVGDYNDPPWRWEQAYLGYKLWTWFIRVLTWVLAAWHVGIAVCWFVELAFAVSVL